MKTKYLLALSILLSKCLYAQPTLSVGLKAGINQTTHDGYLLLGNYYGSISRIHAGAFMNVKFSKLAIQPEILYSQQGSEILLSAAGTHNIETDYLNLPVVFKFYPFSGFNFQAGPQFDFLMGATGPVQTGGPLTIQEISDSMNKLAISGFTGIGWDFSFGLTLDARYIHGLTNIYKSGGSQTKNQLIQFSLGYKLSKF